MKLDVKVHHNYIIDLVYTDESMLWIYKIIEKTVEPHVLALYKVYVYLFYTLIKTHAHRKISLHSRLHNYITIL